MKILIDTGSFSPNEDNIIVFKGGRWQIISRQHYLAYQDKIILEQCKTIERLEKELNRYERDINEKINTMAKSIKVLVGDKD